jgi:hypothetical protein
MHEDKLNNENLANLSPPLVRKVIGLKNSWKTLIYFMNIRALRWHKIE